MKNIICSTTRSWNCGDDFILYGVRYILEQIFFEPNFISYNRHPNNYIPKLSLDHSMKVEKGGQEMHFNPWQSFGIERYCGYDNSWQLRHELESYDLCVFAGTP